MTSMKGKENVSDITSQSLNGIELTSTRFHPQIYMSGHSQVIL
jgi:hypothetical protein